MLLDLAPILILVDQKKGKSWKFIKF